VASGQPAYARALRLLLPPGRLFDEPGAELTLLLGALADELARVDARGVDLVNESDPRTAVETLSDWESMVGLPDDRVLSIPSTTAARQVAIVAKLVARGGQSPGYFAALCAACGYPLLSITNYSGSILRAGFLVGARVFGRGYAFTLVLTVGPATSGALAHADFERVLRHVCAAHVFLTVTYT
jgi:uncharacterized protein YmfQ (DUF2313 family)